jgi:hypothetical protein
MSAVRIDSAQPEKKSRLRRSRDESDSNNDESKKRGRPRLDTQDESTADVSILFVACIRREKNTAKDKKGKEQELSPLARRHVTVDAVSSRHTNN